MADPQRTLELIHGDLDGTLTQADRAELARLLLADPAARRLHDAFTRTEALLLKLPQAEPPDDVRSSVLQALQLPENHSGGGRDASGGVGMRLAAAVVAGLVVVGLGYGLLSQRRDTAALQGSVGAASRAAASLRAGDGKVLARLVPAGTGSRLTLEAQGAAMGSVVVTYDPSRISCQGPDGAAGLSSPAVGQWVVGWAAGKAGADLECNGEGSLRLQSRSDDGSVDEASLQLPR